MAVDPFWGLEPSWETTGHDLTPGRAEGQASRAMEEVRRLGHRLDKLVLINVAMWTLLKDKIGLTDEELVDRIRQIDMLDGKEDGKLPQEVAECPQCGRRMSARHKRCLYCGAEKLNYTPFDPVK